MPLTPLEVLILDRNSESLGVFRSALMENAGRAVAEEILSRRLPAPVVVLVGPGNNGGDGVVAARYLHEQGIPVSVIFSHPGGPRTPESQGALRTLPQGVPKIDASSRKEAKEALERAGTIVDALLGVQGVGEPRGMIGELLDLVSRSSAFVVSVDVPTGMGSSKALRPHLTVTFHDVKEGMTPQNSGEIVVRPIGIPPEAEEFTGPGEALLYPLPREDQHKGEGGVVLVVGGGPYAGAPALSALAALRSGCDLAIVLVPRSVYLPVASFSPNLVVLPLEGEAISLQEGENRTRVEEWLRRADALVVGPGTTPKAREGLRDLLSLCAERGVPVVADSEAIGAFLESDPRPRALLTPHAGEFQKFMGFLPPKELEPRARVVLERSRELRTTILLKGPVDVVSDGVRVKKNATGHPSMSVGGTGDVLAGVAGALLSKGLSPFDAGRLAAYLTGMAGEEATRLSSFGLIATDVVEALPGVLREALSGAPVRRAREAL